MKRAACRQKEEIMLLAVDIGNTNAVVAVFDGEQIVRSWRIFSDVRRTADEYTSILLSLFRDSGLSGNSVDSSIISSVVPELIGPFIRTIQNITGRKPFLLNYQVFDRLEIRIPDVSVHEIGTDLVCNASEAYARYKTACIAVDFGTALSFIATGSAGDVLGVAIAPGLGTAVKSLFSNTAQLPSVPLETPPSSLGTNTIHAIQSGIVLGYRSLVEGLIAGMKKEIAAREGLAESAVRVIATGGLNSVLKPITSVFQDYDERLTLFGLRRIACRLKKND